MMALFIFKLESKSQNKLFSITFSVEFAYDCFVYSKFKQRSQNITKSLRTNNVCEIEFMCLYMYIYNGFSNNVLEISLWIFLYDSLAYS